MTDITYDWMLVETPTAMKLPIRHIVRTSQPLGREEEFRAALDRYMADYRRNRASIIDKTAPSIAKKSDPTWP